MALVEFLQTCIAEDEEAARELQRRAQDVQLTLQDPNALGRWIPGWHDWPDVEALTARVLAECDAKRRIVRRHAGAHECPVEETSGGYWDDAWPCETLRFLALPYADHPDFREEWRS